MNSTAKPYLSKSRLISAWQCGKKLHLEAHHPELAETSSMAESLFAAGNQVGEVAKQVFGSGDGVEIPYSTRLNEALAQTAELVANGHDAPIYEATFQHDGVLARADVLLPIKGGGWRAIEVKAAASVKPHHELDCAIQYWVLRNAGLDLKTISLAHVDTAFVYEGGADYRGLLVEEDLTARARQLQDEVVELISAARSAIAGAVPEMSVGGHCYSPYECAFMSHCWPAQAEYPVMGLGGNKAELADWVNAGCRDIRDVDVAALTSETRLRIHAATRKGEAEVSVDAQQVFDQLGYPRYYLDFETIGPAVPFWTGMRPYQSVPVQWSCHVDYGAAEGGVEDIRHHEFLDLSGDPPMRGLAERLVECLGSSGPVFMYTNYEKRVINSLVEMFPDLAAPLAGIVGRLVDLHPIVRQHYYHPKMLGSWSIKAVSPTVAPEMDYSELTGIAEGMAAADGYIEAINPETAPARKTELEEQLLRYCRFDTEAMVSIVRFLTNAGQTDTLERIPDTGEPITTP